MPRGIPNKGYRVTAKYLERQREKLLAENDNKQVVEKTAKEPFDFHRLLIIATPDSAHKADNIEANLAMIEPDKKHHILNRGYVNAQGLSGVLDSHKDDRIIFFNENDDPSFLTDKSPKDGWYLVLDVMSK